MEDKLTIQELRDEIVNLKAEIDRLKKPQEYTNAKEEESSRKLQAALESMSDAVFISDSEGNFVDFNDAFATFHKFKNKTECAKSLNEFPVFLDVFYLDGEFVPLDMWVVSRALRGESSIDKKFILKRTDTAETWIGSYNYAPIKNNIGEIIGSIVTARDITDQQQLQDDLRKQEYYLTKAQEIGNVGTWEIDLTTNEIIWTDQNFQIFGVAKGTYVDYDLFMSCIHPEDRDYVDLKWKEGIKNKHYEVEHRVLVGEQIKWVKEKCKFITDGNGKVIQALGIAQDITQRKSAEVDLNRSLARLKASQKNAKVGSYEWDLKTGIIEWSDEMYNIYGVEKTFIPTKENHISFIHPDDMQMFDPSNMTALTNSAKQEMEFRIIDRKFGKTKTVYLWGETIFDDDNNPITINGTIQDITNQQTTLNELKANENLLSLIAENYPNSYISVIESDYTASFSSGQEFKNQNLDPELFKGLSIDQIFGEKAPIIRDYYSKTFDGEGCAFDMFINDQHQSYSTTPLYDDHGQIPRILSVVRNVTEQVVAEEEKKRNEQQKRAILKTAIDGFWVNDMNGRFLEVNDAYCKMSGYSEEELLKMSIADIEHIESNVDINARISRIIENGSDRFETQHIKKSGEIFDVAVSIQYNESIHKNHVYSFIHEISSRKKAESEAKLTEKRLDAQVHLNEMTDESLEDIYAFTLDKAVEITSSKIGFLGFVSEDEKTVSIYNWSGAAKKECQVEGYSSVFKVKDAGIWGEVVRTRETLLINDYNVPNAMKRGLPHGHVKLKNYLSLPIFSMGKIVAVIAVGNKDEDYIGVDQKRLSLLLDSMWKLVEQKNYQEELKVAKDRAQKNEERFELAMKASQDGLYDWNLETNEIFYSPRWKAILGYGDNELPNDFTVWETNTKPEDVAISWEMQQKIINKEIDQFNLEFKMKHKDGHWVDVLSRATAIFNIEGKAIRIVGTHVDVTDKNAANRVIKHQASLINQVKNAVITIDFENTILTWNKHAQDLYQWTDSEAIGKDIIKLLAPEELKIATIANFENLNKEGHWEGDYDVLRKDGTTIPVHIINTYLKDNDSNNIGFIGISYDVSIRRKYEADLISAKEKAEESDKLKSSFLANMSHEIRTPMNGILGFSELLKEPDLTGEEQQNYIEVIEKSGERMLKTINNLIEISKIEADQVVMDISEVDVNEQMHEVFNFFKLEMEEKGFSFKMHNPENKNKLIINTDGEKLYGILANLIRNALKYTDEGEIEFGLNKTEDKLDFYVKDTGIGIAIEDQESVFDRFIQVDMTKSRKYEGSGLGLAIAKGNVELLGGKIWFESEIDKGTTFYFTIPL